MNSNFYTDLDLIRNDEYQYKAYCTTGNTVVIAGPGSGKTKILTLKYIKLFSELPSTNSGLACISFSRETVRVLKGRLRHYGYTAQRPSYIGTIHGFCLREIILPFHHLYPEFRVSMPLKIASVDERHQIYLEVLDYLNISSQDFNFDDLDKERYILITGSSQVQLHHHHLANDIVNLFEENLVRRGLLDFIQITKIATRIIQTKSYVRNVLDAKFNWILIDEYQDLGMALHEMVLEISNSTSIKFFVVGDANQSIYGFQGAHPDFLLELRAIPEFLPIELKYNYRSSQHVINASLAALDPPPPLPEYEARIRQDEVPNFIFHTCGVGYESQYEYFTSTLLPEFTNQNIPLNEIAILVTQNRIANDIAIHLSGTGIPYYISKWSFDINADIIQWVIGCAAWCHNKQEILFEDLIHFWVGLFKINYRIDPNKYINFRIQLYECLVGSKEFETANEWLNFIASNLKIEMALEHSEELSNELDNFKNLRVELETGNLSSYTIEKFCKLDKPENALTIVTQHSAKGLEFEVVVLLGMDEDEFPAYRIRGDKKAIEEAHRLCYVSVSRAKTACVLLRSTHYIIPTKNGLWRKPTVPSRFWNSLFEKFGS